LTNATADWAKARQVCKLVTAALTMGADPLAAVFGEDVGRAVATNKTTFDEYFASWIEAPGPRIRKAQRRDLRRHIEKYVLPVLGHRPIVSTTPRDIVNLQERLLQQPLDAAAVARLPVERREAILNKDVPWPTLSTKFVKNVISGSLRAMLRTAKTIDNIAPPRDPFDGITWPRYVVDGPEPFEPEERDRILQWFKTKAFGLGGRPSADGRRLRVHPPYHAFVFLLFWTGMRPSEVAALRIRDLDLARGTVRVRSSRHLGEEAAPKTVQAARIVELTPDTVTLLRNLVPLDAKPTAWLFTHVYGKPIEPKTFSEHWRRCLRALGIRQRGLYATKDSFVTMAMERGAPPWWLEKQTGVRWETLRRHYGDPQSKGSTWNAALLGSDWVHPSKNKATSAS
jgi:integrase